MGKKRNILKGKTGEELAASFLKKNGYTILDRNFTTAVGELDIVATDRATLIFVEVKARSNTDFGYPSEGVDYHKQQKNSQVASQYIKKYRLFNVAVRFDVIEVFLEDRTINHIVDAFDSFLKY